MPQADLLVEHASELVTPLGEPPLRGDDQGNVRVVEDGAMAIVGDRIQAVGTTDELGSWTADQVVDATGATVIPGLVDAHTHLVFAGDRAHEMVMKLEGASYEEILERGGGIHSTVEATRQASPKELQEVSRDRVERCLRAGTTTIEAKSGYALTLEGELELLRVLNRLHEEHPIDVIPTLLGAHAVPEQTDRASFLETVEGPMTSRTATEGLARFCDAFVDEGAFSLDEGRRVLDAGREAGLGVRIHADELARTRATRLGLDLDAASIDHVNQVHPDDVQAWGARTEAPVATLCPVTPFTTASVPYPDARRLIDAGVPVALGSDLNPNAYSEGLWFALSLAVHALQMKPAEALVAATANSAGSLGLPDRGRLQPGLKADALVLDVPSHEHIGYRVSGAPVRAVIKDGSVVRRGGPP